MKITVTYNNKKIEVEKGTTYLEISKYTDIKDTILGVKKNNEILSLSDKAMEDEIIEFFDYNSPDGSKIYKAALKFIFEVALKTRISNSEIFYLHSVPGGILGEIKCSKELTDEDILKIQEEMLNIINNDHKFIKYNILKKEAIDFYTKINNSEKALNTQIYDNIVTIYKLKEHLNNFYISLPYSTKNINKFSLKYYKN